MNDADRAAKLDVIAAFFDDFDARLHFVGELNESDRRNEAFTLCTAYIDALGLSLYWPDERSNRCFVRVLREFGGEPLLGRFHVKVLSKALEVMKGAKAAAVLEIVAGLDDSYSRVLLTESDLIDAIRPRLAADHVPWFQKEIWRGTLAALVYRAMRVPSVHSFGASAIVLSDATMDGVPVRKIDLTMLLGCTRRIAAEARSRSESTVRWFGHDFKHAG